jgi:hypothetical protein
MAAEKYQKVAMKRQFETAFESLIDALLKSDIALSTLLPRADEIETLLTLAAKKPDDFETQMRNAQKMLAEGALSDADKKQAMEALQKMMETAPQSRSKSYRAKPESRVKPAIADKHTADAAKNIILTYLDGALRNLIDSDGQPIGDNDGRIKGLLREGDWIDPLFNQSVDDRKVHFNATLFRRVIDGGFCSPKAMQYAGESTNAALMHEIRDQVLDEVALATAKSTASKIFLGRR